MEMEQIQHGSTPWHFQRSSMKHPLEDIYVYIHIYKYILYICRVWPPSQDAIVANKGLVWDPRS